MGKTILFVDDEKNLLNSIDRILRPFRSQWHMVFAESGHEALDIIKRSTIDIIVTDYRMPGMDGIELLRRVREEYPGIKRIMLTGQPAAEIIELSSGLADEVLEKPCDHNRLVQVITSL